MLSDDDLLLESGDVRRQLDLSRSAFERLVSKRTLEPAFVLPSGRRIFTRPDVERTAREITVAGRRRSK